MMANGQERSLVTLTKFSHYSLRALMSLGGHADRLVSVGEGSRACQVSPHSLVQVVHPSTRTHE